MNPPPIIPVLDLMIGQIVLAQGGRRDDYRPVNSKLSRSSRPLDVAKAIFQQTGCDTLYLADIDTFAGANPNWRVYDQLLEAGFSLWIDANWLKEDRLDQVESNLLSTDASPESLASQPLPAGVSKQGTKQGKGSRIKLVASSEAIQVLDDFRRIVTIRDQGIEPIFSLDQHANAVISRSQEIGKFGPIEWIQQAVNHNINQLIVLDLTEIGNQRVSGVEHPLCELLLEIRTELPAVSLTSGGGVRSVEDAVQLIESGCDHVLVASAIHECLFTPDDVLLLAKIIHGD